MPMIMEHDLDDLFVDAPLPISRPLPKGLLQRVDDLRLSGCCQYVSSPLEGLRSLKSSLEESPGPDWDVSLIYPAMALVYVVAIYSAGLPMGIGA